MTKIHPKKLFLIDGFGALLSAFLLGIVLVKYHVIFGIPTSTLYTLAVLPILFAGYDFYFILKKEDNILRKGLKGIAALNIMYCCLSIGFAIYHLNEIKSFGWIYLILEITLVLCLALIELRIARSIKPTVNQ